MSERIRAEYLIETALDPRAAAESMAGEQSSGTFVAVPGETEELKARAAARVEAVETLESVPAPSLPGAKAPADGAEIRRARATLSWPFDNVGASLPNLLATIGGNLFELSAFSGLRLEDVHLPPAFADAGPGPRFGVVGTRRLAGVESGPLIGTIVKPSVGLSPAQTAALAADMAEAGLDFVKDDELQANGPSCPFDARVDAVMDALRRRADRTGRLPMYAFNLTGEVDEMRARHDRVLAAGGTCVMVSIHSVGLAGFLALARHAELPIHAHRNGWGALSRHPALGFSYVPWSKLWRLAGADHLHVNGLANKFCESDESVVASARSIRTPLFGGSVDGRADVAMPVFSSGQTAAQVPATFEALGNGDLIHAAGGGILGHPDGPAAGVAAMREAWEAVLPA